MSGSQSKNSSTWNMLRRLGGSLNGFRNLTPGSRATGRRRQERQFQTSPERQHMGYASVGVCMHLEEKGNLWGQARRYLGLTHTLGA